MTNLLLDKCQDELLARELNAKGYKIFDQLYSQDYCNQVIDFIDSSKNPSEEHNYSGSEVRIWESEKKSLILKEFFDDSVSAYNHIFKQNIKGKNLLAIFNGAISANDEDSRLGRWHIDSFSNQWKVFLFLKDADENSGPFEFIPGTSSWGFRLRHIYRYLKPTDFLTDRRSYQSLSDKWINDVRKIKPSKAVLCKAGTVLIVSTNAIHRARPCYVGSRYALTTYL